MAKTIRQKYEKDFYAWITQNVQLLRDGRLDEADIENIAEEMEGMGKSEKREIVSRLAVLMAHLLKWKFQSVRRSKSWELTIKNQRLELIDLLKESPSLKHNLGEKFDYAYKKAVLLAAEQIGSDEKHFPKKSPFTLQECLKSTYFPK